MRNILIPTDFSNSSRNAAEYAIAMFGLQNNFVLLNVYEEPRASVTSMVSLRDILAEASNDSLLEERERLLESHPELKLSLESIYGDPNKAISQFAVKEEIDVIVMGNKGASSLTRFIMGSAAISALQEARTPVIVVPESYQFTDLNKVLLTVDLKQDDTHIIQQFVLSLLKEHNSKLTIVTVTEDEDKIELEKVENAYNMHNSLEHIDHDFDVVEGDEISTILQNYARKNDFDLVVTIPRKAPWFKRALNPSISKNLAERLEKPVLALH